MCLVIYYSEFGIEWVCHAVQWTFLKFCALVILGRSLSVAKIQGSFNEKAAPGITRVLDSLLSCLLFP